MVSRVLKSDFESSSAAGNSSTKITLNESKTTLQACPPVHDENDREMKLLTTSSQLTSRVLNRLEGEFICPADATSNLHYNKQCQN